MSLRSPSKRRCPLLPSLSVIVPAAATFRSARGDGMDRLLLDVLRGAL